MNIILNETKYFYNEYGLLALTEKFNTGNKLYYRKEIEYDEKNRIRHMVETNHESDDNRVITSEYYYGEPNNDRTFTIVQSIEGRDSVILNRLIEYDYDIDSLICKKSIGGDVVSITTYDRNDNIIYERIIDEDEVTNQSIITNIYYRYNDKNMLTRKIINNVEVLYNDYDEANRLVYTKIVDLSTNKITKRELYEYDNSGNKTRCITITDDLYEVRDIRYTKSNQIHSIFHMDKTELVHKYDEVILKQKDGKKVHVTPECTTEEYYDDNRNVTRVVVLKEVKDNV